MERPILRYDDFDLPVDVVTLGCTKYEVTMSCLEDTVFPFCFRHCIEFRREKKGVSPLKTDFYKLHHRHVKVSRKQKGVNELVNFGTCIPTY